MNHGNLPDIILLALGVLLLAKSIWAVARPNAVKHWVGRWAETAGHINTLVGAVCILAALGLWALVLLHQPFTYWLLTACGAVFAWWAVLYLRPPRFQKALDALVIARPPGALRTLFIAFGLLALLMIGAALRELLR